MVYPVTLSYATNSSELSVPFTIANSFLMSSSLHIVPSENFSCSTPSDLSKSPLNTILSSEFFILISPSYDEILTNSKSSIDIPSLNSIVSSPPPPSYILSMP